MPVVIAKGLKIEEHRLLFSTQDRDLFTKLNKTRTSEVGAISKAQKAQNIFWEKNLKVLKIFFSFKKSRIVLKNVKGGPFWIY